MRCRRGLLQQCGRRPVCFQSKLAGSGWLVHRTSLPTSSQATPQRDGIVGLSACVGLVGALKLTRARNMRPPGSSLSRHPQCMASRRVCAAANGMSRRSGTIIPQRPPHCAHTSSRPDNLIPQCRHGLTERGVLVSLRAPGAVPIDIVRSWRTTATETRQDIQVPEVAIPAIVSRCQSSAVHKKSKLHRQTLTLWDGDNRAHEKRSHKRHIRFCEAAIQGGER